MGLTVAVLPDAGAPQVGITVTGLDPATPSTISVDVSWDAGTTWRPVRAASLLTVTGGVFVRDFTPALNIPSTYRLTVHSGAVVPTPTQATLTVPSVDTWVQDPMNPRRAFRVHAAVMPAGEVALTLGSLSEATWAQHVDLATPQGAALPVASIGRRTLAGEVPLVLSHDVAATATLVRDLLLTAGQIVVRGLPTPNLLEPVAYCAVGDVTETRLGSRVAVSTWALTVRQTRPTALSIAIPWWTYDQVRAIWVPDTYDQVRAARPGATYLDWAQSPERP